MPGKDLPREACGLNVNQRHASQKNWRSMLTRKQEFKACARRGLHLCQRETKEERKQRGIVQKNSLLRINWKRQLGGLESEYYLEALTGSRARKKQKPSPHTKRSTHQSKEGQRGWLEEYRNGGDKTQVGHNLYLITEPDRDEE